MRQQKDLFAVLRGKHPEILLAGSKAPTINPPTWAGLCKPMHMNSTPNSTSNAEANWSDYF